MPTLKVTAAKGAGNETSFSLVDAQGVPVNLTTLGATVVTVEVCGPLVPCGTVSIDSSGDSVSFLNDVVKVAFGGLDLSPSGQPYHPKISYITAAESRPEVLAGSGFNTQIELRMVC